MSTTKPLQLPTNMPWQHWVERWDRMQERYLVRRTERIQLLVGMVREMGSPIRRILDLGCGTGSLMHPFLDAFPQAEIHGIDFDPVLLPLAQQRLRRYSTRARLILADLRSEDWRARLPASVDAVISATALHWLTEVQVAKLHHQLWALLRPGGFFVNADHFASQQPQVQKFWEQNRDEMRRVEAKQEGEDWDGFWELYARALGLSGQRQISERVIGGWDGGVEEGLPLEWHFADTAGNVTGSPGAPPWNRADRRAGRTCRSMKWRSIFHALPSNSNMKTIALFLLLASFEWCFGQTDTNDSFLSGSFTPPKDHPSSLNYHVWQGTLKLPKVKISLKRP